MGDEDAAKELAAAKIVVTLCGSKDALRFTEFLYDKKEFAYQDIQKHLIDMPPENLNKMIINFMKAYMIKPVDLRSTSINEATHYHEKILKLDYKMLTYDWYKTTLIFENVIKKDFPSIKYLEKLYNEVIKPGDLKEDIKQ